jgi:TP901 family phage tail tape measure protein
MPLGTRELLLILRARDEASRAMHSLSRSMKNMDTATRKAADAQAERGRALSSVGVGMMAVGGAGAAVLTKWTQEAGKYNQEAAKTLTQVDKQKTSIKELAQIGKDVARAIPAPFDEMQKSLFDIFSSMDVSITGAKHLLTEFSKAAVAGQVDLQDAARGTIGILNAYRMGASGVNRVNDVMFQLVRKGVGTYGEFSKVMGRAVPSAVRAGQSIEDLSGMMAFLTRNGLSAAMASASAARALDAISNPNTVAKFKDLAGSIGEALGTKRAKELKTTVKGFDDLGVAIVGANGKFRPMHSIMEDLSKAFTKLKLTGPEIAAVLQELFKGSGGTIQARRFFDIAVKNFEELNVLTKDMRQSSGAMKNAYDIMFKAPQSQVQLLKNNMQILKVELGEALIPVLIKMVDAFMKVADWFNKLSPTTKKWIAYIVLGTSALLGLVGVLTLIAGGIAIFAGAAAALGIGLGSLILIILAVVAVIALIAGAVYLIIKNWTPIKAFFLKIWDAIVAAATWTWKQIVAGAMWLWGIMKAVWNGIVAAINFAWSIIRPIWNLMMEFARTVLVPAFQLLASIFKLAWDIIVQAMKLAWNIIKAIWKVFKLQWDVLVFAIKVGIGLMKAQFRIIGDFIKLWWNNIVKPVWNFMVKHLKGPLTAAFNAFGKAAKTVWDFLIKLLRGGWVVIGGIFKLLKTGVDNVRTAFRIAVDGIGKIWNSLKEKTRGPVKFIIETVYRGGIRKVWGGIRKVVPELPDLPYGPKFAQGGIFPGYTPGRDVWKMPMAAFSGGEGVLRPEITRALGKRWISGANRASKSGAGAIARFVAGDPGGLFSGYTNGAGRHFANGGIVQKFAGGGIVGGIKSALGNIGSYASKVTGLGRSILANGAKWVAERVLKPIINKLPGGNDWKGAVGRTGKRGASGFLDFIINVIDPRLGGGSMAVVKAARKQLGVPYSWGGGGPAGPSYGIGRGANTFGFDCSGLTEYAWWQGVKTSIGGVTGSQIAGSKLIAGPRPGALGFPHPGHVVLASKPGYVIQSPFTGGKVNEGRANRSYQWRWPKNAKIADTGGYLDPGMNYVLNKTGRRERILDPQQTQSYETAGQAGVQVNVFTNEIDPRRHAAELGWEIANRVL